MEVQKLTALFMLCLATTTSVGWCRMSSTPEVTHDPATQRDVRADWTASKISEGEGAGSNSHTILASSKVSETMSEKASGAMESAKETVSNAYNSMSGQGRKAMESASDMAEDAKSEANKAYEASGPAMESAKEQANKAYEASGPAMDSAKEQANKAYEASGPTMESAGNMASDMVDKIKEGTTSAYHYVMGTSHVSMGENVQSGYNYATEKASDAASWTSEKAGNAKEAVKEKASGAYGSVSQKTGETVRKATENSASYEEAKEKAYDAYLHMGSKFEGAKESADAHRIATEQVQGSGNSASYEQAREKAYDSYLYMGSKFEGAKEAAAAHGGNK